MKRAAKRPVGRPKTEAPRVSITTRLRPDQMEKIIARAEEEGTTQSAVVQKAVASYLKGEIKPHIEACVDALMQAGLIHYEDDPDDCGEETRAEAIRIVSSVNAEAARRARKPR
jgi:hypothetical protein